jgi:hypothetical protein
VKLPLSGRGAGTCGGGGADAAALLAGESPLPAGSSWGADDGAGGGGGGEAGAGAVGAASSVARGARSTGASPASSGPSRYGFGSPCSAAGRVVRGPRPRRGGRRRSFMQVLSVRVNAREACAGMLAERLYASAPLAASRRNVFSRECHAACAAGSSVDDGIERRDWCCASIACRRGSLTRGQATVLQGGAALDLASCPPTGDTVGPRIDARSVDAERCRTDGRNEYGQLLRFAQPTPPGCELHASAHTPE